MTVLTTSRPTTGLSDRPTDTPRQGGRVTHWPALDGLRGLAVLGVLAFHAGFDWARGGFLGVSTFFTLSGFLITSILLAERRASGRLDLRRFWERRARRLLPAAIAGVILAAAVTLLVGEPGPIAQLPGDVLSTLGQVANWRFLLTDRAYADLFSQPSALLHYWSLSIEEQFYVFFPLVVSVAVGRYGSETGRRRTGELPLAMVCAALFAASAGLASSGRLGASHLYYGTETRIGELMAGAFLAAVLGDQAGRRRLHPNAFATTVASIALLACLSAWVLVDRDSEVLLSGGLHVYALGSALVLVGCMTPGPLSRLLEARPLRALGRISYGVYVYHWPLMVALRARFPGIDPLPLFTTATVASLVLASLSWRVLERPILEGRTTRRVNLAAAVGGLVAVAVLVGVAGSARPQRTIDLEAARRRLAQLQATRPTKPSGEVAAPSDAQTRLPPPPPSAPKPAIGVFGDSTALMTGLGLNFWMHETGLATPAPGFSDLGCGLLPEMERDILDGPSLAPEPCLRWREGWQTAVSAEPDLAVVQVGAWEITDQRMPGEKTWRAPGDPTYDELLLRRMNEAAELLLEHAREVVWILQPPPGLGADGLEARRRGRAADPARTHRVHQLMREVARMHPGDVHVLDLASWIASTGEDRRLRPDGVHFSEQTALEVARRWLGPRLLELHEREWIARWKRENGPPKMPRRLRVLVAGDAPATRLAVALDSARRGGAAIELAAVTDLACPPTPSEVPATGTPSAALDEASGSCPDWRRRLPSDATAFAPHVVVLALDDDTGTAGSSPTKRSTSGAGVEALLDSLRQAGALVVLVSPGEAEAAALRARLEGMRPEDSVEPGSAGGQFPQSGRRFVVLSADSLGTTPESDPFDSTEPTEDASRDLGLRLATWLASTYEEVLEAEWRRPPRAQ
ncbi:MAG: hypothetical protein KatS3mg008_0444 [Acidimicrobiales bacterium]|nr:MAG: hypothetical protein KatS3mg008_0444 [Acidimicrobiales bacterium]